MGLYTAQGSSYDARRASSRRVLPGAKIVTKMLFSVASQQLLTVELYYDVEFHFQSHGWRAWKCDRHFRLFWHDFNEMHHNTYHHCPKTSPEVFWPKKIEYEHLHHFNKAWSAMEISCWIWWLSRHVQNLDLRSFGDLERKKNVVPSSNHFLRSQSDRCFYWILLYISSWAPFAIYRRFFSMFAAVKWYARWTGASNFQPTLHLQEYQEGQE